MTTKTAPRKRNKKPSRAPNRKPIGVIEAGKAYNLDRFMEVMGCNWATVRDMKKRGLKVRKDGDKRVMIRGEDYLEYLGTLPVAGSADTTTHDPAPQTPTDHNHRATG